MTFFASYRGQPLVALIGILGGWVVMRTIAWNVAFMAPATADLEDVDLAVRKAPPLEVSVPRAAATQAPAARRASPTATAMERHSYLPPSLAAAYPANDARDAVTPAPPRTVMAHNLMWMAALSHMPLPAELDPASGQPPLAQVFYPVGHEPAHRNRRWSADAWLYLRGGSGGLTATGAIPATYGASQAGAVLRYRLAPLSRHRPAAYLRASAALGDARDRELAVGLSARPVPGIPVVAAAELRASDRPGGTRLRPAVSAITEIAPLALPHGVRLEIYGQAGYVAGRGSTAFVDGQARADRKVAPLGRAELRAGAGIWGGAQKGASRIDVGPTATLALPLRESAGARLGVDWRFRVVGHAAPSSGPALTISAGF